MGIGVLGCAASGLPVSSAESSGSTGIGFRMMRSTIASNVWLRFLSSRMPSSTSVIAPSMRTAVALLVERFELLAELALASPDNRREHGNAFAGGGGVSVDDLCNDLLGRLTLEMGRWQLRAVRLADARVQQTEVVIDLGNGADGRARRCAMWSFCSMEIAGERPSIASTSGRSIWSRNWRAYAESVST